MSDIPQSGSLTKRTDTSSMYQLKVGRFSDVWTCAHQVAYPEICSHCEQTEHVRALQSKEEYNRKATEILRKAWSNEPPKWFKGD